MVQDRTKDRVKDALAQLSEITEKYIRSSIDGDIYEKALECLQLLRETCISEDEAGTFNDFLKILKEKYHKSGEHRPFFDMLANNKVTLIDTLESNLSSVISPQQAEDFLKTFSTIEDTHAQ